jgi:hypothetical protein
MCDKGKTVVWNRPSAMGQVGVVNPSPFWEERSCIGVVSHIPTLCELRNVMTSQTHVRALQGERVDQLTASLKK